MERIKNKQGLIKLFTYGTQNYELMEYLIRHDSIELWRMIAPSPNGLGLAQYNGRVREIRIIIAPHGWIIKNIPGREFILEQVFKEDGQYNLV